MRTGREFVRAMNPGEEDKVDALLRAAFARPDEAVLVRKLRKSRTFAGEQVMPMGDGIVGYYALSGMVAPKKWLALAPVAVAPEHQRQGLGRRMIGQLAEWARITKTPVVVLGSADFYARCGFSSEAAASLISAYGVDHLLVAGVTGRAPKEALVYPAAFEGM